MFAGAEMHRVCGADGAAVHNKRVRGAGVRALDASVRLPCYTAHPGALHARTDRARARRAARPHRPAHTGTTHLHTVLARHTAHPGALHHSLQISLASQQFCNYVLTFETKHSQTRALQQDS